MVIKKTNKDASLNIEENKTKENVCKANQTTDSEDLEFSPSPKKIWLIKAT